jgi:hypothetical protein
MTTTTALRPELDPLPVRLAHLPVDDRGYPVPWFVGWVAPTAGAAPVPDFRTMDPDKWRMAVTARVCWVCGQPLGRWLAFPIGPMCAITRTTSEPPCHRECAEWSIRNCPFLSQPRQVRRTEDMPAGVEEPGGIALTRNPGVTCLWITRSYEVFDAGGKPLITVGALESISWWREGRAATRAEVEDSVDGGMLNLLAAARVDGPFAVAELEKAVTRFRLHLPASEDLR